jgi:hypothetical protein
MPRTAPLVGASGSVECADRARLTTVGAPRSPYGELRRALVDAVMPHLRTIRAPRPEHCRVRSTADANAAAAPRSQKRPYSSIPAPPESTTGAADQLAPCFDFSRGALGAAADEPVSISRPSAMANKPPA